MGLRTQPLFVLGKTNRRFERTKMVTDTSEKAKTAESTPEKQSSQQGTEQSTSQERTLTESEHKKLVTDAVNAALGAEGRKHKIALTATETRVRNELQDSLAKIKEENTELQEALDDMAKDDEDKSRLAELIRANKKKSEDLEGKIKAYEPKIAKVEEWELTEACNQIAAEFDGADVARLKRLASRTKFNDFEDRLDQIRELAEDMGWNKKSDVAPAPTPEQKPRKMDSDVTTGTIKGKTPTLEELRASSPAQTEAKVKSGEWLLPAWMV